MSSYRVTDQLVFNVSPGLAFEDEEPSELKFAMHLEGSYDFEPGNFHLGPLLEFAWDQEDYHISIGLHLGFGF